MDTFSACVT